MDCRSFRRSATILVLFCVCFFFRPASGHAIGGIINTKHNLSVSGPGPIKSLTETRICVFCHTPHNASPGTPLWSKEIQAQTYSVYTSTTLKTPQPLPQPFGPTKLCLSCHDGTIALGAVVGGTNLGISSPLPSTSPSYFGLDLSTHHPVAFSYYSSLPNTELATTPPSNLDFGGADAEIHCNTCHDPHDDKYGNFLAMDNSYSALCTACHQMTNWSLSGHATLVQGCEVCHTPHFAVAVPLLSYTSSDYCLTCHSSGVPTTPTPAPHGEPTASQLSPDARHAVSACLPVCHSMPSDSSAPSLSGGESLAVINPYRAVPAAPLRGGIRADIKGQIKKFSSHRELPGAAGIDYRGLKGAARATIRNVRCVDCHNPHATNRRKATAPFASGMLDGVSGVDRNGTDIDSVSYEYEVCFKCHSDYTNDVQYIPRVINMTNLRLAFNPTNPSYHPVIGMGRNVMIPSIPSPLDTNLKATDMIYCTDCHGDDAGGSKGPHGSSYPPILRERCETADGTPETYQNYALCYRCHNRTSILSDVSFRKKIARTTASGGGHSGHLATGAPCTACHDPHGVNITAPSVPQGTGSHTHLINFDTRIVLPLGGSTSPVFTDQGRFRGSCTLVCHGKTHNNLSYP